MGVSNYKLYGGNKATNTKNHTISLYELLSDVQNQGYKVVRDGQVLYAKYGEINDINATKIRVKIGQSIKALLSMAVDPITRWDFNNVDNIYKNPTNRISLGNNNVTMRTKYGDNDYDPVVFQFTTEIPQNAKNARVYLNWRTSSAMFVDFDLFGEKMSLDGGSSTWNGTIDKRLKGGDYWNNSVSIMMWDNDGNNPFVNFYITNFKIEFEI